MSEKHMRPRWGWLYLILPLALALFWVIDQVHASDLVHRSLEIGAVLILGGCAEAWRRSNRLALLYHYLRAGEVGEPLYRVREVTPIGDKAEAGQNHPAIAIEFYSDLFTAPVTVVASPPPVLPEPMIVETRDLAARRSPPRPGSLRPGTRPDA